jgi:DNA-binding CsgD family transcriptional regulator/tetratricopeptide (TPR) repeat protein
MQATIARAVEGGSRGRGPFPLPLVGRDNEVAALGAWLEDVAAGRGGTTLLAGVGGVGKTRLVGAIAERAARQGWTVTVGRAYPVETGVPYAVFADALTDVLRGLTPASLAVMTRGDASTLANICPAFSAAPHAPASREGGDVKSRLHWSFTQFLGQLAAQRPILLVLENLQWADSSSLELLHFVARQMGSERVALLCTYNETELEANPTLRATEQSLLSLGAARLTRLEPLAADALQDLVRETFHADAASARALAGRLYSWTRGNPFFVEEVLKALVESGALHEQDGSWLGWEAELPGLPRSIRDAVTARVNRLGASARTIANLAAVIGTRTSHDALVAVSGMTESDVLTALDELRAQSALSEEVQSDGGITYEFAHPLVRDVLYGELGIARGRLLHATVAEALETLYGARADAHADELAYHFARAEARGLAGKAVRYLAAAGRDALKRYANREAANYLNSALEHLDRAGTLDAPTVDPDALVEDLAQARQRLGDYDAAKALWTRARTAAERAGDPVRVAAIERRLGLGAFWSTQYEQALAHFDVALAAAERAANDPLLARTRVARAMTLQALGKPDDARTEIDAALAVAERLGDAGVLARVHRSSQLLHVFIGPTARAHADGMRAIELAESAGERGVAWSAHWAMAMVGGLSGNSGAMAYHLGESERLADELGSPVLRCWTAEIAVELHSGTGDWDAGLALAERTIPMARALRQRVLLPRLLVWAAMIHLHRGNTAKAKEYLDEGWKLSSGDKRVSHVADVHSAVPVHAGLVAYHVAMGDYRRAIEIGDAGLALVDRTGYLAWGIHRLLPMTIEAALWLGDLDLARRYEARLRKDSLQLGHRLGIAWADTCEGLVAMLRKDYETAAPLLRSSAEALEAIPWLIDAARVRRKLAWVLAKLGDIEGATRELRRAHDAFVRMRAEVELSITRDVIRELGLRPPAKAPVAGVGALTGREVDVARLVAARKSNKEIAALLGISPRTVSTHLSSIFTKLGVASRGELADVTRRQGLPAS